MCNYNTKNKLSQKVNKKYYTFYPIRISPFNEVIEDGWKKRKEIEIIGCDYNKRLSVIVNKTHLYSIHGSCVLENKNDLPDQNKEISFSEIMNWNLPYGTEGLTQLEWLDNLVSDLKEECIPFDMSLYKKAKKDQQELIKFFRKYVFLRSSGLRC